MAKAIPNELKGVVDGDQLGKGSGIIRNAGVRRSRSTFDATAEATTTSDTLSLGMRKAGDAVRAFEITATTNMSAASVAIGTADDPDKYLAAAALPAAGASQRRVVLPSAAGYDPLTEAEELIVTISGATIPNGLLVIDTEHSMR